jgi:hypothetical protein
MSFFLVTEVSRFHGVPGVIVECPCTIQSRKALPNGAPGMNILLGQNVYPTRSSPHISVLLSVLRFYGLNVPPGMQAAEEGASELEILGHLPSDLVFQSLLGVKRGPRGFPKLPLRLPHPITAKSQVLEHHIRMKLRLNIPDQQWSSLAAP